MFHLAITLFLVVVAPIWIIAHYVTRWRTAKSLSPEDERRLAGIWEIAERLEDRMDTIERILEIDEEPKRSERRRPGEEER